MGVEFDLSHEGKKSFWGDYFILQGRTYHISGDSYI